MGDSLDAIPERLCAEVHQDLAAAVTAFHCALGVCNLRKCDHALDVRAHGTLHDEVDQSLPEPRRASQNDGNGTPS